MYALLLLWSVCAERSLRTSKLAQALAHKPRTSLERIKNSMAHGGSHDKRIYTNPAGSFTPSIEIVDYGKIVKEKRRKDEIIQRVREEALDADADPFDPRAVPDDLTPEKQKQEWASLGPVPLNNLFDAKKQADIAAEKEKWAKLISDRDKRREGKSDRKAELAEAHARDALRAKAGHVQEELASEAEDLEHEDFQRREKAKMWTAVTDADFAKDQDRYDPDETRKWAKRHADDVEKLSLGGTRLPKPKKRNLKSHLPPLHQRHAKPDTPLGTLMRKDLGR